MNGYPAILRMIRVSVPSAKALTGTSRDGMQRLRKMPSTDERLALINTKVERAKEHLADLKLARDRFVDSKPYRITREYDPQTRDNIYRVFGVQVPDVDIALIAGDVIHNLRSALDHLAYQLVLVNGSIPSKQTAFPVFDDTDKYKTGLAGKVKGMAQTAVDAINATEPYQGGLGAGFWVIHYLDIADKHHALLTTLINVTGSSFTIPGFWERGYRGVGGVSFPNFGQPLKDGDVIATREADMDKDLNLTLDIAFTEPEVIEGKAVVEVLQRLTDLVANLIADFKPLLV